VLSQLRGRVLEMVEPSAAAELPAEELRRQLEVLVHELASRDKIEITARRNSDGAVLLTVRDYGPGVPKTQLKKIFELFYRAENELTRETVGTGIGLALVRQLAAAMGARVDARNCEPGAEFRVSFPAAGPTS